MLIYPRVLVPVISTIAGSVHACSLARASEESAKIDEWLNTIIYETRVRTLRLLTSQSFRDISCSYSPTFLSSSRGLAHYFRHVEKPTLSTSFLRFFDKTSIQRGLYLPPTITISLFFSSPAGFPLAHKPIFHFIL